MDLVDDDCLSNPLIDENIRWLHSPTVFELVFLEIRWQLRKAALAWHWILVVYHPQIVFMLLICQQYRPIRWGLGIYISRQNLTRTRLLLDFAVLELFLLCNTFLTPLVSGSYKNSYRKPGMYTFRSSDWECSLYFRGSWNKSISVSSYNVQA